MLVSQPTHPAFYEKDPRHYRCNVCKGLFTCEPPSRHELMSSFTGPELAALITAGCMIGSHAEFSAEIARQLEGMPAFMQERSGMAHWRAGAFLITEVAPLDARMSVPIPSQSALDSIRARLGDSLSMSLDGQTLRLVNVGAFEADEGGEGGEGGERGALRAALAAATHFEGMSIVLERDPPPGCGDDHVTAINLTRVIEPINLEVVNTARNAVIGKFPGASQVPLPCHTSKVAPRADATRSGQCGADAAPHTDAAPHADATTR